MGRQAARRERAVRPDGLLQGQKVLLREKRLGDALKDYAWRRDAELARLDACSPLSLSFSEYLAIYAAELRHPDPERRGLAIETFEDEHIGNCMCYNVDRAEGEAELGIVIGDRDYWDKGYGTDAIAILTAHIFHTTRLDRLYLCTLDWNVRARRCFEKCGFVSCGRLSKDGQNFVVMELRRNTWERSNH